MRPRFARFSPQARADLIEIRTHIALTGSPAKAGSYVTGLTRYTREYAAKGLTGSDRPEFGPGLRSVPYDRYHIIFRVNGAALDIAGVKGAAQDIPVVLKGDRE
jgi:plasmid stabilization system protein ParE